MQTFIGKITHISPITERGEYKSLKFRVEETYDSYPQSCEFTKSAKGDNGKYIDEFEKYNPVGSIVDVEYSFKSVAWKDKFINEVIAWKVFNQNKSESNSTQENANQEQFNQAADTNETTTSVTESSQDMDDDLPF